MKYGEVRDKFGIIYLKVKHHKYLYRLVKTYRVKVDLKGKYNVTSPFISLDRTGMLTIRAGYAWDGPSGPAINTDSFMRASLVHDALYQLMRMRLIPWERERIMADKQMRVHCVEDGMWRIRAWWAYHGVRIGGQSSATPADGRL